VWTHVFGPKRRVHVGALAEAQILGYSFGAATWLKDKFQRLGAATYFLSRLAWGSVLSWLDRAIDKGLLEPVTFMTFISQDETPFVMRDASEKKSKAKSAGASLEGNNKTCTKVVQSEVLCGFVCKVCETGEFNIVWAELPTCLQHLSHTTGVGLKALVERVLEAPLASAVRRKFGSECHLVGGDRAAPNLLMDKLFMEDRPAIPRLSVGCQVHCTHTIVGAALVLSHSTVSGCIGLALAQCGNGSVQLLRTAVANVLKDMIFGRLPQSSQQQTVVDS
jgi:hypothetical protein